MGGVNDRGVCWKGCTKVPLLRVATPPWCPLPDVATEEACDVPLVLRACEYFLTPKVLEPEIPLLASVAERSKLTSLTPRGGPGSYSPKALVPVPDPVPAPPILPAKLSPDLKEGPRFAPLCPPPQPWFP